ncbi:MAG: glycosyltransferase family 1 protein [Planctomycetota bacterium]
MLTIDARYLAQPPSGIPRYTRNLLDAIRQADPARQVRVIVHPDGPLPEPLASHGPLDIVVEDAFPRSPTELWRWRGRLARIKPTVLHCPDVFAPLWPGPRVLVTLHDAIPLLPSLDQPGGRSKKQRLRPLWRAWVRRQLRRADAVLTVSQHSADDLHRLLNIRESKLHVLHNAVPPPVEHERTNETKATPYLLCVGRFDPYKNAVGLVEAFAQLATPLRLIFVGPTDPRYPEAKDRAMALNLEDRVDFLGSVDDATLDGLYRGAAALVMPSRYEGFGLPAIEAMHRGVPVVASNGGALPEVVGDAAIVCDATNPDALANAIHRVLNHPDERERLTRAGYRRADAFAPTRIGVAYLEFVDRLSASGV